MSILATNIVVKTTFEAFHRWPDAPEQVSFLRSKHRHLFYVTLKTFVKHDDRDVEFFIVKRQLDSYLAPWKGKNLGAKSCEMMAKQIMCHLTNLGYSCFYVSVFEDNENGAELQDLTKMQDHLMQLRGE